MGWRFDPRLLATLEAVVRRGSLEAAAAELDVPPADVVRDLGDLDRLAGTRVVTREPVRATQAGRALLEAEAAIAAATSRAAAELAALSHGTGGELRVGAFAAAAASLVPPALARLHAAHPGIRIDLRVLEPKESHAALLRGDLDLAVTYAAGDDHDTVPAGILRLHLCEDPLLAALPAAHPLAREDAVDVGHDALALVDTAQADARTALALVAAGLGAAVLPRVALLDPPPGVVVRPLLRPQPPRQLYTSRLLTTTTLAAVRTLTDRLADVVAGMATEPEPAQRDSGE